MGQVNQPSNTNDQIRELRRRVDELYKKIGLTSATITRGGLTFLNDAFLRMVDDNDELVLYFGPDHNGVQIINVTREGGVLVFATVVHTNDEVFWCLCDRGGNIVFSDNADSGIGIGRPWFPIPMYPRFSMAAGYNGYRQIATTALAGETQLWEARATITHSNLQLSGVWGTSSGGPVTTTYRLKVNGATVGSWVGTTLDTNFKGPFDVSAHYLADFAQIEITAQVTSGSGVIAADVTSCVLTN